MEESGKPTNWKNVKGKFLKFLHEEGGLTSVEYALAGALITAALVGAFVSLGDQVATLITVMTNAIS